MAKKKTDKASTTMLHLRIPVSLRDRLDSLTGAVAGTTVCSLAREALERGVSTIEKDPARELIRTAS